MTSATLPGAPAAPPAAAKAGRSLFGDRWPGPAAPPSGPVLGAIVGSGVAAAALLPAGSLGVGWPITALVLVGATVLARRSAGPSAAGATGGPRPITGPDVAWAVLALALAAVGSVRAAEWLANLCQLAAAAAAALAVAGRSSTGVPGSLTLPGLAALRAVPWVGRGLRGRGAAPVVRTGLAVLAGVELLAVFLPLLAAADGAFAHVVGTLLPTVDGVTVSRWIVLFGLGAGASAGAAFVLLAPPEPRSAPAAATRLRCLDWALPVGALVAAFALFVGVQFVALFGSDSYVLRTTGLTYAEYARSGFWQLLLVTALALAVLAAGSRWAPAATAAERAWKRGLLAALAGLTLVIVASAIGRMWLYQQAYGFTVLRLLVLTCELWLGAGFVIALVVVVRLRPAGLTRLMVAAGMIALLGLAVLNPERFIAEHNVARLAETGRVDLYYLSSLSADAVPALLALPEPARSCVLDPIADRTVNALVDGGWREANLSRFAARDLLAGQAPQLLAGPHIHRWLGCSA